MLGDLVEGRREGLPDKCAFHRGPISASPPAGANSQTAVLGSQSGFKRDEYRNDLDSGQYTRPVLEYPHFLGYSKVRTLVTKYRVSPKQEIGTPGCSSYVRATRFPAAAVTLAATASSRTVKEKNCAT